MINFGKYKGKSFEYVLNELEDYSYLVWMNGIGKEVPNHIFNEAFKMYQNELITPSTNELLNGQFIFYIHCQAFVLMFFILCYLLYGFLKLKYESKRNI